MEIHQVSAKYGWHWINKGFQMFLKAPMIWMLVCFIMLLIAMTLALIPIVGQFFFTLIYPVLLAGIMIGCLEQDRGGNLELRHLFIAFKVNVTSLITIGGLYLIGQVLILGLVMIIGGSQMTDMMLYGKRVNEAELSHVMSNVLTATMVALLLSIPLMMAAWFSPLLVVFHDLQPISAMKKSFFACLKNIIPFQLYGLILIILTLMAVVPYGIGLIILFPIILASIYVSYKNIFLGEEVDIPRNDFLEQDYQNINWSNETEKPVQNKNEGHPDKEIQRDTPTQNNSLAEDSDIVECGQCKISIPKEKAIRFNGLYFCSNKHFQEYQSSMNENTQN